MMKTLMGVEIQIQPVKHRAKKRGATCDWGWPGAPLDALDAVHQQRRPRLVHREARVPVVSPTISAAAAAAAMPAGAESAAARVAAAHAGGSPVGGVGVRRPDRRGCWLGEVAVAPPARTPTEEIRVVVLVERTGRAHERKSHTILGPAAQVMSRIFAKKIRTKKKTKQA
jgi:hypothetical protein